MDVSSKEYGSLLIMSKISSDVQLQISRKSTNEVWKIDELLDTIKSEIDALVASEEAKSSGVKNRKPPIDPKHSNQNISTSANASVTKGPEEFKIRCAYCGSLQYSTSCDKVFNCESSKKIPASSNWCFNCLQKGHNKSVYGWEELQVLKETPSSIHMWSGSHKGKCINDWRICKQRNKQYDNVRDDDYDQCECTTQIVLLQTARAVALDETGKIPIPVRMLFDTGSQRTYVTENLPSRLKLKISSTRKAKSQHLWRSSLQISELRLSSLATQTTWLSLQWSNRYFSINLSRAVPHCPQEYKLTLFIWKAWNWLTILTDCKIQLMFCQPSSDIRQMCETRVKFLHHKLKVELAWLREYRNIIQEQERNGIIKMADKALGNDSNIKGIHYSPHHAVVQKDCETTKVHVV